MSAIISRNRFPAYLNLIPGKSLHAEFQFLRACGISEHEVLRSATINPDGFLGVEKDYGTVEINKMANLVILSENPMNDIRNSVKYFK